MAAPGIRVTGAEQKTTCGTRLRDGRTASWTLDRRSIWSLPHHGYDLTSGQVGQRSILHPDTSRRPSCYHFWPLPPHYPSVSYAVSCLARVAGEHARVTGLTCRDKVSLTCLHAEMFNYGTVTRTNILTNYYITLLFGGLSSTF